MTRALKLEWPGIDVTITAPLMFDQEPILCDILWKTISKPLKMACRHTLSTGEMFCGGERPPRHPVETGSQAAPLGKVKVQPNRIEPGTITYAVHGGYGGLSVWYGRSTESLFAPGSVIAQVKGEGLADAIKAGRYVWDAEYNSHRLVTMWASRVE